MFYNLQLTTACTMAGTADTIKDDMTFVALDSGPAAPEPGSLTQQLMEPATSGDRVLVNQLVHRIAGGDVVAYEQLYRLTAPRVAALCRRIVGDVDEADDVTQEVMVEMWLKAGRFDDSRGSAMGWLLASTHHRAVDRVRTLEAARRRHNLYASGGFAPTFDDIGSQLFAAAQGAAVTTAVSQLSHLRRQALAYAFYDGHSHAHASFLLGVPLGTFKSGVRDALQALHTALVVNDAA